MVTSVVGTVTILNVVYLVLAYIIDKRSKFLFFQSLELIEQKELFKQILDFVPLSLYIAPEH